MAFGLKDIYVPVATGFMDAGNGETVFGLLLKGAQKPKIQYSARVCFNEAAAAMAGFPVIAVIESFATAAREVIGAFDR